MSSVTAGTGHCDGCHAPNSCKRTIKSHIRNSISQSAQRSHRFVVSVEIDCCVSTAQARNTELPYFSSKMSGESCNSQDRVRAVSLMCDRNHASPRSSSKQTTYCARRSGDDAKTHCFRVF